MKLRTPVTKNIYLKKLNQTILHDINVINILEDITILDFIVKMWLGVLPLRH